MFKIVRKKWLLAGLALILLLAAASIIYKTLDIRPDYQNIDRLLTQPTSHLYDHKQVEKIWLKYYKERLEDTQLREEQEEGWLGGGIPRYDHIENQFRLASDPTILHDYIHKPANLLQFMFYHRNEPIGFSLRVNQESGDGTEIHSLDDGHVIEKLYVQFAKWAEENNHRIEKVYLFANLQYALVAQTNHGTWFMPGEINLANVSLGGETPPLLQPYQAYLYGSTQMEEIKRWEEPHYLKIEG